MRTADWKTQEVRMSFSRRELVGVIFPLGGINDLATDEFELQSTSINDFHGWTKTGNARTARFERVRVERPEYGRRGQQDEQVLRANLRAQEAIIHAPNIDSDALIRAVEKTEIDRHTTAFEVTITGGWKPLTQLVVFPDSMSDEIMLGSKHATNLLLPDYKEFPQCLPANRYADHPDSRIAAAWVLYCPPDSKPTM